ncbi:hypothetical protein [Streptacidiphilus fuscans]|uniref:Uncharacterized protein n=1 Tax=Streptacidiphilus fuscans TaxID=2789292 RepID=A0A931B6R3_9ACTN|nr:hypothetical protein [Streptacidiphilus fuscans]MBF9071186.1 hypothetical protein [Streptacidiphilus fuscans]
MTVRVDPGAAGFHADRLARVDAFVEAEIAARRMPGAVLGIVRGDWQQLKTLVLQALR